MSTEIVQVVGLGVQSLATVIAAFSALVAARTLSNSRRETEEQNRPFVRVRFKKGLENTSKSSIYLLVENIGRTAARDVKVGFSPPLPDPDHAVNTVIVRALHDRFARTIPTLAPGEKLASVWWTKSLEDAGDTLPKGDVEVHVNYKDLGDRTHLDTFSLSTSILKDETRHKVRSSDPQKHLARAVEDIGWELWDH